MLIMESGWSGAGGRYITCPPQDRYDAPVRHGLTSSCSTLMHKLTSIYNIIVFCSLMSVAYTHPIPNNGIGKAADKDDEVIKVEHMNNVK